MQIGNSARAKASEELGTKKSKEKAASHGSHDRLHLMRRGPLLLLLMKERKESHYRHLLVLHDRPETRQSARRKSYRRHHAQKYLLAICTTYPRDLGNAFVLVVVAVRV